MIDPATMIALTRPDVQRQIVETYLAGFEAGYDLAVDLMRAQNRGSVGASDEERGAGNGQNRHSGVLERFSSDAGDEGRSA